MKILKLNGKYSKVADSSIKDYLKIKTMIDNGWSYVSKKEYKNHINGDSLNENIEKPLENQESKKEYKKDKKIKNKTKN